jgi:hypothetical protein
LHLEEGILNSRRSKLFGIVLVLAMALMAAATLHAKKELQWQNGRLLDSNTDTGSRLVGINGNLQERRNDRTNYQIETDQYVYVVSRSLVRRRDKPLDVTINGPVRFAIDGLDVVLKDDKGKEHKLTLEKKILKSANVEESK